MQSVDISVRNNEDLLITVLGGQWWDLYNLAGVTMRMQVREPADGELIYIDCSSVGESDQTITIDGTYGMLSIFAPAYRLSGLRGTYQYDCRIELEGNRVVLFGGSMTITQGVTRGAV